MLVQVKLSCSVTPTPKVMKPKLKDLAQFAEEFSDRTISQHFGGQQTSSCLSVSLMWHLAFGISILRLSFGEEGRIISLEPLLLQLAKVEEPAALSSSANTLAKPPPTHMLAKDSRIHLGMLCITH